MAPLAPPPGSATVATRAVQLKSMYCFPSVLAATPVATLSLGVKRPLHR